MAEISHQDKYYLNEEGDAFFTRNFKGKPVPELRDFKRSILEALDEAKVCFDRVLEYGCNYADLLNYLKKNRNTIEACGVDTSKEALDFAKKLYGDSITLYHGTIASNALNQNLHYSDYFDLIIVEDVFSWVSRETLFHSIANVDLALKEGGCLFIRDHCPDEMIRNPNHHVKDGSVFCHKIPGSTSKIFESSGIYSAIYKKVYDDTSTISGATKKSRSLGTTWADTILKKSYSKYYDLPSKPRK